MPPTVHIFMQVKGFVHITHTSVFIFWPPASFFLGTEVLKAAHSAGQWDGTSFERKGTNFQCIWGRSSSASLDTE